MPITTSRPESELRAGQHRAELDHAGRRQWGTAFSGLYDCDAADLNGKSPIAASSKKTCVAGWNTLTFGTGVHLKPDTGYTFVLRADGLNFFVVVASDRNLYPTGSIVRGSQAQFNPAQGFTADPLLDLCFKVNVK